MIIKVQDIVGDICMTYADGRKLHEAFRSTFDSGETVTLDFVGTRVFVSQFFNAAVGVLLGHYSRDELRRRLLFTNLPGSAKLPLQRSVENADHYYRDPQYRAGLDKVLTTEAAEV